MNGKYYVYELRDPDGVVFYVGKGSGYRSSSHKTKALRGERTHKAEKIRSIVAKGGDIQVEVVYRTDDEAEAYRAEVELIARHGRGNLTNHTDGGNGVRNLTKESREKIAEGRRGVVASAETRERQRQAKLGTKRSHETKEKIRRYQTGRSHPWARVIALANRAAGKLDFTGKTHTPETIEKMRAAKMGHTVSEETRRKISETKKRNNQCKNSQPHFQ